MTPNSIIVGAGLMGRWHARFIPPAGGRLVAVVDPNAAAAERLAGSRATFATLTEALAAFRVDVVHVCTPPQTHAELIAVALNAGCHVVAEKPVSEAATEAQRLAVLASEKQRVLVPVHQFPFQRGFRQLRQRLSALGPLGRVEFATATAGADGKERPRDVLLEIFPHAISLFRALGYRPSSGEMVQRRFDDAELEVSWNAHGTTLLARIDAKSRPTFNELRVFGERGTATLDLHHGFAVIDATASANRLNKATRPFRIGASTLWAASTNLGRRAWTGTPAYPGLVELLAATYGCVRDGVSKGPIDPEEFIVAAEVVERLRRS